MDGPHEIWTIGHAASPIQEFLAELDVHGITVLADVRAHPGSRRSPQFGAAAMAEWLPEHGIDYLRLPALAGRRRRQHVDPALNNGWRNQSFKNYADYTLGDEYRRGIDELTDLAARRRVAIMCGEPVPWRCHRLLIANTLTERGWTVHHLIIGGGTLDHVLGRWGAPPSVGADHRLTYPG